MAEQRLLENEFRNLLYGTPGAPAVLGSSTVRRAFRTRSASCRRPWSPAPSPGAVGGAQTRCAAARVPQPRIGAARKASDRQRQPLFCAGCPHNSSTKVPKAAAQWRASLPYMARWIEPHTSTFTQMGGEGTPWIGQAPFTDTEHVFANLGDGTYFSVFSRSALRSRLRTSPTRSSTTTRSPDRWSVSRRLAFGGGNRRASAG